MPLRCRNLDLIKIRRFTLKTPKPPSQIKLAAWDTETCKDGYSRLVTWCDETGCYHHYIKSVDAFFALINKMQVYDRHVNVFWNIDFDRNGLIKWLLADYPEALQNMADIDGCCVHHHKKQYWIKSIPGKFFAFRVQGHHMIRFFDLWQFYTMKLEHAAEKYSTMRKSNYEVDNMSPSQVYNDQDLLKYALQDSRVTYDLAKYLYTQLEALKVVTDKPYSKAALAQLKMREALNGCKLDIPNPVLRMSWDSYFGGRFETIKRGSFTNTTEVDLNSAYPAAFTTLPDITDGKWTRTSDYSQLIESPLSFAKIKVETQENTVSPICIRNRKNINIYPRFKGEISVTGRELTILKEWPDTKFSIHDGYAFWPSLMEGPFSFVSEMYEMRKKLQQEHNDLERLVKTILNSGYGKTMQVVPEHRIIKPEDATQEELLKGELITLGEKVMLSVSGSFRAGQLFCPPYGATITAQARVKLLRLALDSGFDNIISFVTDAAFLEDAVGVKTGDGLGEWKIEDKGDLLMMGNGVYQFAEKQRCRGFKKFLPLNAMLQAADGLATSLPVELTRVLKLKAAAKQHRMQDLNKFYKQTKTLELNSDIKRVWPGSINVQKLLREQQTSTTLPSNHPSFT